MIWNHLKTFLWLRWRLVANLSRRQGVLNFVLYCIIKLITAACACAALLIGYLLGSTSLTDQPVEAVMLVWDGLVVAYLIFTVIGIMVEVQQADMLSLNKFLHLPVTPANAFLINYLGSSLNLSELVFAAGMLGLAAGLLVDKGAGVILLLPLITAFFFMITALTQQVRGWLASMITNPRRRQTMIVLITMAFVLVMFLPSLPGMFQMYRHKLSNDAGTPVVTLKAEVKHEDRQAGPNQRRRPMTPEQIFVLQTRARYASAVLPPGWVAYGAVKTLEGGVIPALMCLFGMGLIGAWSLLRSYRTTLRLYRGDFIAAQARRQTSAAKGRVRAQPVARNRLTSSWRLPFIPDQAYAVTAACFRSLLRMPEMKMTLLSPLLMLVVFGGMFSFRSGPITEYQAALRAMGVMAFMLIMSILYMLTNQFAYDRAGFRALVLSPASRREVLLGKNIAFFPFAFGLMVVAIGLCEWFAPLRPDHLAAVAIEIFPIYLFYCLIGNSMSIYLPLVVKPGSALPATGQGLKLFLRFLATILSIAALSLLALPLGFEYLMHLLNWGDGFPTYFLLTLIQTALMTWLYSLILDKQGEWLSRREQEILAVVTTKAD